MMTFFLRSIIFVVCIFTSFSIFINIYWSIQNPSVKSNSLTWTTICDHSNRDNDAVHVFEMKSLSSLITICMATKWYSLIKDKLDCLIAIVQFNFLFSFRYYLKIHSKHVIRNSVAYTVNNHVHSYPHRPV